MISTNVEGLGKALFDEAGDALFLLDPETDVLLDVNPTAERLSGFSRAHLLARPSSYWFRFGAGERGSAQRLRQAATRSGVFHSQEGYFLRTPEDGVWVPVNLTVARLHVKPQTLALITARDISEQRKTHTQLKKVEEELRRVLAAISDCLWSAEVDAAGRWKYCYFSPVVSRLTGRPPEFFGDGQASWRRIVHPEDLPRWEASLARLRAGEPSQEEYRVVWPDGTMCWVRDSVRVSKDDDGRLLRLDGVLSDVTVRKLAEHQQAETAAELGRAYRKAQGLAADLERTAASDRQAHQQLKKAQSQLVQSEKLVALGQMVAGVAHEINNPLAFVINNAAVLARDMHALRDVIRLYQQAETAVDGRHADIFRPVHELADQIDLSYTLDNLEGVVARSRDGLKRIQQIVKDLRDFARLDENDLLEVNLNPGIASTLNIVNGRAVKKNVQIEAELAPLPAVLCYPAKINQVVLNLVANAIDACPVGGKVTVRTTADDEGVQIHVRDNGHGIDPNIRDKIFDPFFTTKPPGKGTGLGLSISHGIVEDHGGRIDVDSEPGQGAHFTVRLPLRPPQPPRNA